MSACTTTAPIIGCLLDTSVSPPSQTPVTIHYEYGVNDTGGRILVSTLYSNAAGEPITLAGTQSVSPGVCQPVSVDIEFVQLCDDTDSDPATDNVPFIRKYTRISSGITGVLISESFEDFELDMETEYTVVGDVGTCGVSDTETNDITLCDSTGTAFIRRVKYINGVQVSVGDFELDGTTAYTAVGDVKACPTCAPATAKGVLTSWGA